MVSEFELKLLYVSCRDADIDLIKKAVSSRSCYEIKYAIRQLFASAYAFGDKYTQSICNNMLDAISLPVSGGLSADQHLRLHQCIDLLSIMAYGTIDND